MGDSFSSTFRAKVTIQGPNIREQNITQANQTYLATFKNSGSYYSVGLGLKENRKDVQIFNLESFKKLDTIKNMQYAPYQDLADFRAGQYVYWNDTNDDMIWLITSTDKRLPQKAMSVIKKCNVDLNWIDKHGNKHSQKAVFEDKFSSEKPSSGDDVKLLDGQVLVSVQLNEYTEKIPADQTFIFGGDPTKKIRGQKYILRAKRYEANDYELGEQLLVLLLEKTSDNLGSDDLYNNITNIYKENLFSIKIQQTDIIQKIGFKTKLTAIVSGTTTNKRIDWNSSNTEVATIDTKGNLEIVGIGITEITASLRTNKNIYNTINIEGKSEILPEDKVIKYQLTPLINVLLRGDEVLFSIFELNDEIKQSTKFRIKHSGISSWTRYYSIEPINSSSLESCNQFKIINLNQYLNGKLKIEIYKINIDLTEELVRDFEIRLGGLI